MSCEGATRGVDPAIVQESNVWIPEDWSMGRDGNLGGGDNACLVISGEISLRLGVFSGVVGTFVPVGGGFPGSSADILKIVFRCLVEVGQEPHG